MTAGEPRGFAGLVTLVSDVAADLAAAERLRTAPPPRAAQRADNRAAAPARRPQPARVSRPRMSTGAKWAIGIVGGVVLLAILGQLGQPTAPGAPPPSSSPAPPTLPPVAAPADTPATAPPTASEPAPAPTTSGDTPQPLAPPPVATLPPPTMPPFGAIQLRTKPPAGNNLVLNIDQIRYCLAESLWIKTVSPVVNTRSGQDVDRFNARVADYNSRCSHYGYRRGTLEQAQQEIEAQRAVIEADARLEWLTQR